MHRTQAHSGHTLLSWTVAFIAWELAGRFLRLRPDTLPTPSRIVLEAWRSSPELLQHLLSTATAWLSGLGAALALALAAGLVCASFQRASGMLLGFTGAWHAIPVAALAPVLVLWFGYGEVPRAFLVTLVTFPLIAGAVLRGLRRIPAEMPEMMHTLRATPAQVTMKLMVPYVLPPLCRSLKTAATAGVAAAVTAEFVQAEAGLGYLMLSAITRMNTPLLFASFLCAAALAALLIGCIKAAERVLSPWA